MSNIAMNHRVSPQGDLSIEQWHDIAPTLTDQTEAPEDALAPTLFTRKLIHLHGWTYLTAFITGRELRAPACLNPEGLERFLVARYRLREDDIDHPDWFGWGETALTAPT